MTVLSNNVEDMLKRLETHSKSELNLIRALSEAIRQVDDQTLRELRNLTLQHELRRESILGELQLLATRMCQLPTKPVSTIKAAIDQPPIAYKSATAEDVAEAPALSHGGHANGAHHAGAIANGQQHLTAKAALQGGADWRQAAQAIENDLDFAFGPVPTPRH